MRKFLPIIIICIVVAFLFGPTLFPSKGQIIFGGDLQDQFYYWKSFYKENLLKGVVPFWNPYIFSGTPFLAHPSTAAFYPLNIIFLVFPINNAFSIYLYIHFVIAGITMYWFGRSIWDRITALSGAFIYSLSGMLAARVLAGHIDIISTLVWIPFVFGAIQKAIENPKRKNILLAVLALTIQILAGYQFVVILTLILCFFQLMSFVLNHIMTNKKNIRKNLFAFILIVITSFGIASIQWLPTYEFVQNSIRKNGLPYDLTTWGSYQLDTFRMYINPTIFGSPLPEKYSYNGPGPNFMELSYFIGIIPMVFILLLLGMQIKNLIKHKKLNPTIWMYVMSLTFFALMSLGKNFFLHKFLYDLLPPFRLFRFPAQYLLISVFILAVLASYFISQVKQKIPHIIICILIIFELFIYSKPFFRLTKLPIEGFNQQLITSLGQDLELYRFTPDYSVISNVRKSIDNETPSMYRIFSTGGYNPIVLSDYYQFIALSNDSKKDEMNYFNVETPPPDLYKSAINFLNSKYILIDQNWNTLYKGNSQQYVMTAQYQGFKVFENKNVLPRFFLVPGIDVKNTQKEIENSVKNNFDYSNQILVNNYENLKKSNCSGVFSGKVTVSSYELNTITLQTTSNCDGFLSSSEVYYPGWNATIDGKPILLMKSNLAFRGLEIPSGNHTVIMYYQPTIYYIGIGVSIISIIWLYFMMRKIYL